MTSPNEDPRDRADPQGDPPDNGAGESDARGRTKSGEDITAALLGLSKLYSDSAKDGVSPQVTDASTQALVLILGSAPSFVAFEGLLSAQNSSGLMYHNAVSNQQKTNLLGMAMTAKCVRYMLDPYPEDVIDETIFSGNASSA